MGLEQMSTAPLTNEAFVGVVEGLYADGYLL